MRSRLYWKTEILLLHISIIAYSSSSLAQNNNCTEINEYADPGFNFTESISRWGSKGSFDIDGDSYVVRDIKISNFPIFDINNPKENNPLFRWANNIHFDTKDRVLENQLLFEPNEHVDSSTFAESERILRSRKYVADAKIRVINQCGKDLDIEVVTREVWTLSPEISLKSGGGDTSFDFGIRDTNILGSGQQLSLNFKNDPERNSYDLLYKNPNINGSGILAQGRIKQSTDGYQYTAQYQLPYYSLRSNSSWNLLYDTRKEILTQYKLGNIDSQVDHTNTFMELSRGFNLDNENTYVSRINYGLIYDKHDYNSVPGIVDPEYFPENTNLAYPFVDFELIEDNFAVAYNISQIYRTEDLHIGKYFQSRVGYQLNNDKQFLVSGKYNDTLLFQPKKLLQLSSDWKGRWNPANNRWENVIANLNLHYHRGQTDKRTLYLGIDTTFSHNLDGSGQVSLGGNFGLRGFDSHYFNGESSIVATVEQRYFSDYHLFQLARVGYAAFFDIGKVYKSNSPYSSGVHSNVGVGLRLAPSKSESGQVVHIDLAYPVNGNQPGAKSLQFILELKSSF